MTKIKILCVAIIGLFSILCFNPIDGTSIDVTTKTNSIESIRVLPSSSIMGDNWPMFRGNSNHTAATETILKFGTDAIWNFSTSAKIYSSPAVVDGFCYFASENGSVFCLDANDGSLVWNDPIGGYIDSSPAVVDGLVYIGDVSGYLNCLNATTGDLAWHNKIANFGIYTSPVVVNGLVYSGDDLGNLKCLDAYNGSLIWGKNIGADEIGSSPVVVDGLVYIGSTNGSFYCFNATNGNFSWDTKIGDTIYSSPTVADGLVYIGNDYGNLVILNATDGNVLFEPKVGNQYMDSSPAVANGLVYIGDDYGCLSCLYATNGSLIWHDQIGYSDIESSPAVANGFVYIGDDYGCLNCMNATSGELLWSYQTGDWIKSSPAIANGMVYVGSDDGNLYCLPMILCRVPSAPLNFNVTAGSKLFNLKWNQPADDGGWPLSGYSIYRGTSPGNEVFLINVSASITSYNDTEIMGGQTYYYKISAFNPASEGSLSSEKNGVSYFTPTQPLKLQTKAENNAIILTWQAPSDNGGHVISGYKIYRGDSSESEVLLTTVGNILTYTDTGLSLNTTYYYKVSAVNSLGEGKISSEISATCSSSNSTNKSNSQKNNSIGGMGVGGILSVSTAGVIGTVITVKKRMK